MILSNCSLLWVSIIILGSYYKAIPNCFADPAGLFFLHSKKSDGGVATHAHNRQGRTCSFVWLSVLIKQTSM